MNRLMAIVGISCVILSVALTAGCATAEKDRQRAEAAGEDPIDVQFAPLDDTVDEINRKMNAPDDADGEAGN